MGAAHTHIPPPLVEVNAPGGKVLVPPGTAFTVHPPSYARSRSDPYTRGPVYLPVGRGHAPPFGYGERHRGAGWRRPNADIDILEESEDSESTLVDGLGHMSPIEYQRGVRRQGGVGRRGTAFADGIDRRPRSAPEMPLAGYPGMGGMGMGMASPQMGGMGMNPMGSMGPGGMGGMGMSPLGMPPEYTSNPSFPRYSGGAADAPGAGMNPYTTHPGRPPSPAPSDNGPSPEPTRRATARSNRHHERVPMGAYATDSGKVRKLSRSRTEPQVSAQLNRGHSQDKKIGPSGKEWIDGDAFLDACTCTTACKCRKSQRVLYRSRNSRPRTGESDSEDEDAMEYGSGEIRYILKDDLGRNCDDHSACRRADADSEKEEKDKKRKNKDKSEEKQRKEQFQGFKEEMLDALDERFEGMKRDTLRQGISGNMATSPFERRGMARNPYMTDESMLNPRVAQQMGAMAGDPYGIGLSGMGGLAPNIASQIRDRAMRPQGMPTAGMNFEDDMSGVGMDGLGPWGLRNPYATPGMMGRQPMRPDFTSPQRGNRSGDFGLGGIDIESRPTYSNAIRGRGGMTGGRLGGAPRRPRPEIRSDAFDAGPSRRSGLRRRGDETDNGLSFGRRMGK